MSREYRHNRHKIGTINQTTKNSIRILYINYLTNSLVKSKQILCKIIHYLMLSQLKIQYFLEGIIQLNQCHFRQPTSVKKMNFTFNLHKLYFKKISIMLSKTKLFKQLNNNLNVFKINPTIMKMIEESLLRIRYQ